ncbi:MAG: GldG family protein [Planctomycetota bacterium]|nr:GldG family protein [Planctomycetota bacterium]
MSVVTNASEKNRSRRARFAIALQVALGIVLAIAAVVLVTWLSERRGFRARFDLTHSDQNTLDPVSIAVIEKLPTEIAIDVFFRAAESPLEGVAAESQAKMRKLLRRASDESGGKIVVEEHDLSNPSKLAARAQARMSELKLLSLEAGGLIVITAGARREILRLRPDIADLDPGQKSGPGTQYIPPRVVSFRGEEALMSALLKVSLASTLKLYVTEGHGEASTKSGANEGLVALVNELGADGFDVRTWDGAKQGGLPEDCDVLAILGPEQSFTGAEADDIRRFVDGGGRLVASVGQRPMEGPGTLASLLEGFGVKVRMSGFVAHPVPSATGGEPTYGIEECADLAIGGDGMPALNPITEPLRRSYRRVSMLAARALDRHEVVGTTPAALIDLLRAPEDSWLELPTPGTEDRFDWIPTPESERARFRVAAQISFSPRIPPPPRALSDERTRPESRVVVLGSTDVFLNYRMKDNRDFVLNAFNWVASREYRVKVSKTSTETRRIDVKAEGQLSRMYWIAIGALPLVCILLGVVIVWRRNRR